MGLQDGIRRGTAGGGSCHHPTAFLTHPENANARRPATAAVRTASHAPRHSQRKGNVGFVGELLIGDGLTQGIRNPCELQLNRHNATVEGSPSVYSVESTLSSPLDKPARDQPIYFVAQVGLVK